MKKIILLVCAIAVLISVSACSLSVKPNQPLELNINEVDQETTVISSDTKTYIGDGFSFEYPAKWIEAEGSLWTQEQYNKYQEMVEKQKTDPGNYFAPAQIEIKTVEQSDTMPLNARQYVNNKYGDNNDREIKNINGFELVRFEITELYPCQIYYIHIADAIISFTNYNTLSQVEFENILNTLNFLI